MIKVEDPENYEVVEFQGFERAVEIQKKPLEPFIDLSYQDYLDSKKVKGIKPQGIDHSLSQYLLSKFSIESLWVFEQFKKNMLTLRQEQMLKLNRLI